MPELPGDQGEIVHAVRVLGVQFLANAAPELCCSLGVTGVERSLCLLTTDSDDATYIALDAATKAAEVEVAYGRSFYAGAANATTPNAGEVLGVLVGQTPGEVKCGLDAALRVLEMVSFRETNGVPYLAHTVASVGSFLAREAGVAPGSALAYLIAPPLEAMVGLDAALKAAEVKLVKFYAPPTETNFGGGLLSGSQSACEAACAAFAEKVREVAKQPIE